MGDLIVDLDGMTGDELRDIITAAREALDRIEAVESARRSVESAVTAYAQAAGVSEARAWKDLAPDENLPDISLIPEYDPAVIYDAGDLAKHQGKIYEALDYGVTWSPMAMPQKWREVVY